MDGTWKFYNGMHGAYFWLEDHDPAAFVSDLCDAFPCITLGKHVAVTAVDGTPIAVPPYPGADPGWTGKHNVALSPRVTEETWLPTFDYTEWYVFDEAPDLDRFRGAEIFANYLSLSFRDAHAEDYDDGTDPIVLDKYQARLWAQIERFGAESYLAESEWLLFATRREDIFLKAREWRERGKPNIAIRDS